MRSAEARLVPPNLWATGLEVCGAVSVTKVPFSLFRLLGDSVFTRTADRFEQHSAATPQSGRSGADIARTRAEVAGPVAKLARCSVTPSWPRLHRPAAPPVP